VSATSQTQASQARPLHRAAGACGAPWSRTWDFIADATHRGGALRILTILHEHTRKCHVLHADQSLTSEDVLEWLGNAVAEHGAPEYLRSVNGP